MIPDIHFPELMMQPALWLAISVLTCAVVLVISGRRRNRQLQCLVSRLETLEKQSSMVLSGSLGMGQRITALEKRLRHLQATQDDIRHNDLDFSYTQAQKLIEQGVDARTVSANSGLSASEVGLMQLLHQQQSPQPVKSPQPIKSPQQAKSPQPVKSPQTVKSPQPANSTQSKSHQPAHSPRQAVYG